MNDSPDRPVRIGVVPFLDGHGGGVYQYSVTLLDALPEIEPRPELVLFADRRSRAGAEEWRTRGYEVVSLWPRTTRWRFGTAAKPLERFGPPGKLAARMASFLAGQPGSASPSSQGKPMPAFRDWIARSGVDFLILASPSLSGVQADVPYVMAVHDLQHRLHPEFPEMSAGGEWEFRERLFRTGIGHSLGVLVDSEVGREDVLDCYGDVITADRVHVLPFLPASYMGGRRDDAAIVAVRERFGLPDLYLFFPAQFWPHKNHVRVVRALARIRAEHGVDISVVMCGSAADRLRSSVLAEVRRTAADEKVEDLVHILGYVPDESMAPLYSGSRGVLLPTFLGPTNIPIVEAWALGVPALSSDVRGIREQCGDAAVLVDPLSVSSIAAGIYSLWSDEALRTALVAAGARRLALYGHDDYVARLASIVADATRRVRGAGAPATSGAAPNASSEPAPYHGPAIAPLPGPIVSVVIPARNRASTILAALESVAGQTFESLEMIVVDDGSTDDTVDVVGAFGAQEPRLRILVEPRSGGAQAARNTGIRAARGEWIAFLDSDDTYYPTSIQARLDLARTAGVGVVHSACDAIGPAGPVPFPIPPVAGDAYRDLLNAPAPMFQGMLVKRDLLLEIGLLDESVPAYQEWDTSIRLAAIASFGFVDRPTFLYDLRTGKAISHDSRRGAAGYERVVSEHWRVIARVAGVRVLAEHYRILADMRARAGDRRGAFRCALIRQLLWPLSVRRTLQLLGRIARSNADAAGERSEAAS